MSDRIKALTELRDAVSRGEYEREEGPPRYNALWDKLEQIGISDRAIIQCALHVSSEACAATIDALIENEVRP